MIFGMIVNEVLQDENCCINVHEGDISVLIVAFNDEIFRTDCW